MRLTRTRLATALAAIVAATAAAPIAAASEYFICDPTESVCVEQAMYGDPTCEDGWWGEGQNSVYANAGPASAFARGFRWCYNDGWYSASERGINAGVSTEAASAYAWWVQGENEGGFPSDGKGGGFGGWWREIGVDAYGAETWLFAVWHADSYSGGEFDGRSYCYTYAVGFAADQFVYRDLRCPFGDPPETPDLAWGELIP